MNWIFNRMGINFDAAEGGGGGAAGGEGGAAGGEGGTVIGGGAGGGQAAGGGDGLNDFQKQLLDQGVSKDVITGTHMQPIKDIKGLVSSYVSAQSMVGKDKITIPGENATEEERNQFHTRLGRPENAEGYGFSHESLPEQMQGREDWTKWASELMFRHGVPKAAAEGIFKEYAERMGADFAGLQEASAKATAEALEGLKKEFGTAYDQRTAMAGAVVDKLEGAEDYKDFFQKAEVDGVKLGNHPLMIKMMVEFGRKVFGEGQFVQGQGGSLNGSMTPDEAKAKIKELEGNAEWLNKWRNKDVPGHAEAVAERTKLFSIAYPN